MAFINRVTLRGFLEITQVETIELDGNALPVLHGYVHTGNFFMSHRLLITAGPADYILSQMRRYPNGIPDSIALQIGEPETRLVYLDGTQPLVSIEGKLLSCPGYESVVEVKWIYFLTIVPPNAPLIAQDQILRELVRQWDNLSHSEREQIYTILSSKQKKQRRRSG